MLTRKDLLLEGIQIPESDKQSDMAMPPEIKGADKKKKHGNFSGPLFKESWHSNRLALLIVSLGNAIIMAIIIGILSTLHINSTNSALQDLFSNADTESTVKSSAISLYSSYSNTATAYQTFVDSDDQVKELVLTNVEEVTDSTLTTAVSTAKVVYDLAYFRASGTDAERNATAKTSTMNSVDNLLDNTSFTETEKKTAKLILSYYFDIYPENKSATTQSILIKAVPKAITDVATEQMNLSDENSTILEEKLLAANQAVYENSSDKNQVAVETSFELIHSLAEGDSLDFIDEVIAGLQDVYLTDKSAYVSDTTIRNDYVKEKCQDYIVSNLEEYAYYQYLPDFTVEYKTNDLGYPIHMVKSGRYTDSGVEIMEEEALTEYNPDQFISVGDKMGTKSNLVQKMRKKILTGVDYTDEEVKEAQKEAKEGIRTIKTSLESFMKEFLTRTDGKNSYYDGSSVNLEAIQNKAVEETADLVKAELIEQFNEKNDSNIESIDEITAENSSMSGAQLMNTVRSYASSGITAFNTYHEDAVSRGYSTKDSLLVGLTKGSEGVMNSLPSSVDESLSEMADMNTYGIIVGVVAFGISGLLIPMVYTILLSKSLVSEKVETGSLAFTLSTPTTRRSFIVTEAIYLLFSETVMALVLLLSTLAVRQVGIWMGSQDLETSLPINHIILYAFGNYMVTIAVSGICFLSSCHFNKTNKAIGIGGGLTIFFFICSILGLFGTKAIPGTIRISLMNIFNYMTIDSLFDAIAVMNGDYWVYFGKLAILLAIAAVTYTLGSIDFEKKDLPL